MTTTENALDQGGTRSWLTFGRFAMILGGLIFLAYPQVLTGFHSFVFRDYGLFGYPLAHYHRECFWRGEIPLWNPYNNMGLPFLAQWGTMVLYPPSLIYILLPLPWSLGFFTLLHVFFGGLGMFLLARQWTGHALAAGIAGTAFAFHGFMLNCLMWPNYCASMGWMPWVVLAVTQAWKNGGRHILLASLAGGMQMLSGTPEVILFTWLLLVGLWFAEGWKSTREALTGGLRFALVVVVVTALAAAQLLPFLELLQQSHRTTGFDGRGWAVQPWGWANLFVPLFRMHGGGSGVYFQSQQNLTSSYYAGVAIMLAGILALLWVRNRRVWVLFGATVLAFIFAMGDYTPVYGWLRTAFPPVGFMRYSSKALIPTAFTWPLLAAFGVAWFLAAWKTRERRPRPALMIGLVVAFVLVIVGISAHAWAVPYRDQYPKVVTQNAAVRILFLGAIVGVCFWLTRDLRPRHHSLLQMGALLLVCFDFLTHVPQQNPTIDREALTVSIPWLRHMKPRPTLGESRALLTIDAVRQYLFGGSSNSTETYIAQRNGLFANINLIEAMPKADGFYALYLKNERDIQFRIFHKESEPRPQLGRFLGFCQVTAPTNVVVWHARTNYLPLVTAGQMPIFAERQMTLDGMMATNFAPEHIVYLTPAASNRVHISTPGAAQIISRKVTSHKVEVTVRASVGSLVVIAQAHYPRWKAFVDGQPVELLRANHAFQAVAVPPGDHRVEVKYDDSVFRAGALISLLSLAGMGGVWMCRSRSCTRLAPIQDTPEPKQGDSQPAAEYLPQGNA